VNRTKQGLVAIAAASTITGAFAAEHVGRDAEKGYPARWYEPADTPQKRYETAMKEAAAALAEALRECRSQVSERRACEAQAREQHRKEVADSALPANTSSRNSK
jgi:hypothetical protein